MQERGKRNKEKKEEAKQVTQGRNRERGSRR
jgi:hypothetical protein